MLSNSVQSTDLRPRGRLARKVGEIAREPMLRRLSRSWAFVLVRSRASLRWSFEVIFWATEFWATEATVLDRYPPEAQMAKRFFPGNFSRPLLAVAAEVTSSEKSEVRSFRTFRGKIRARLPRLLPFSDTALIIRFEV